LSNANTIHSHTPFFITTVSLGGEDLNEVLERLGEKRTQVRVAALSVLINALTQRYVGQRLSGHFALRLSAYTQSSRASIAQPLTLQCREQIRRGVEGHRYTLLPLAAQEGQHGR
jgi:hypothetical protein